MAHDKPLFSEIVPGLMAQGTDGDLKRVQCGSDGTLLASITTTTDSNMTPKTQVGSVSDVGSTISLVDYTSSIVIKNSDDTHTLKLKFASGDDYISLGVGESTGGDIRANEVIMICDDAGEYSNYEILYTY